MEIVDDQIGCLSTARARIAGSAGIYRQASTDGRDHRSEHLSFADFRYLAASADAGNFSRRQGDEFRSDLSNRSDYADWQSRFGASYAHWQHRHGIIRTSALWVLYQIPEFLTLC